MINQQNMNYSGKKVLLIIITLFILAVGASGYYFRNDLPVIKDLVKSKDIPVSEIKQEENMQTPIQQQEAEAVIAETKIQIDNKDVLPKKPSNSSVTSTNQTPRPTIVGDKLSLPTDKKQLEQLLATNCSTNQNNSMCITIKAVMSHDIGLCNSITETESKFYCILEVDPSKITNQLCDLIPLYAPGTKVYSSGVNVYNTCYSELANQSANVKYCKNRINVMDAKDTIDNYCLTNLALINNSTELCKEIIKNNDKYQCFTQLARKNSNKSICNMIDDSSYRLDCELSVK